MMKKHVFLGAVLASTVIVAASSAQTTDKPEAPQPAPIHFILSPTQITWSDLPAGMARVSMSIETRSHLRYALVQGDQMKAAIPFTIRLGCSEEDKAAGGWCPRDVNIVVLKGTFGLGTRNSFDAPALHKLLVAGNDRRQLLSQASGSRINRRQGTIITLAAAAGFGVGYATYYFKNRPLDYPDERAHAMAAGTFSALISGVIAWAVVGRP